jgi:hypothetical protein
VNLPIIADLPLRLAQGDLGDGLPAKGGSPFQGGESFNVYPSRFFLPWPVGPDRANNTCECLCHV